MSSFLVAEQVGDLESKLSPLCKPYYQRLKGFMAARTPFAKTKFPKGTFAPGQICKAYRFPKGLPTPKKNTKYGIISLGGNVPVADIAKFIADNNYPTPNLTGEALPGADTTTDVGGANVENNLDWQMVMQAWHYAYPTIPCTIHFVFGPNNQTGIADSATQLFKAGCDVISCSWGAAKSQWTATSLVYHEAAFKVITCPILPASGDNSMNDSTNKKVLDYPAASIYCWAVGGTSVSVDQNGAFISSKGWGDGLPGDEGGGGGYDTTTLMPDYQKGVVAGSYRAGPDSSYNADPTTGYLVWSDGAISVIGGTSASAPLMSGRLGVAVSQGMSLTNYQKILYTNYKSVFNDVVVGSNGSPATAGFDTVTGLGEAMDGGIEAAMTQTVPPPPITAPTVNLNTTIIIPVDMKKGDVLNIR